MNLRNAAQQNKKFMTSRPSSPRLLDVLLRKRRENEFLFYDFSKWPLSFNKKKKWRYNFYASMFILLLMNTVIIT